MASSASDTRRGEFALIAELFAPLATSRGAFGLTDDAALLPQRAGHDIVVTTDAVVSGVHFLDTDPASTVAQKALRVNLSDLAAKGARPSGYLLALSLPPSVEMKWLKGFSAGLALDQEVFGVSLLGGDTTSTAGPITIAITAFGHVPRGKMLRRNGARPGDLVFVTGTIGDAGGGLAVSRGEGAALSRSLQSHLVSRYRVPQPRVAVGPLLRSFVNASLDVSDGLIADLAHIAATSDVRIVVAESAVPRSAALRALWPGKQALRGLTCGDDYEIAFTVGTEKASRVMSLAQKTGVLVSQIGRVEKGAGVSLRDGTGREIECPKAGWTHF